VTHPDAWADLAGRPPLGPGELLAWLVAQGGLASSVPELPGLRPGADSRAGWRPIEDGGGAWWAWDGRRDPVPALPPGLRRGAASQAGMRRLLDALSQLLWSVLPPEQGAGLTAASLERWLDDHLPLAAAARARLLRGRGRTRGACCRCWQRVRGSVPDAAAR
jgi:hypothetical protein